MPKTALIVVDMIQTYEFPEGEQLAANVERMLPRLERLLEKARDSDALVIWVNDSFGDWSTNRERLLEKAHEAGYGHLIEDIAPGEDVLFVLKARHSIFYQTPWTTSSSRTTSSISCSRGRSPSSASCTRRWTPTCATSRSRWPGTRSRTSTRTSPTPRCG